MLDLFFVERTPHIIIIIIQTLNRKKNEKKDRWKNIDTMIRTKATTERRVPEAETLCIVINLDHSEDPNDAK